MMLGNRLLLLAACVCVSAVSSLAQEMPDAVSDPAADASPAPPLPDLARPSPGERLAGIIDHVRRRRAGALEEYRLWRDAAPAGVDASRIMNGLADADKEYCASLEAAAALVDKGLRLSRTALSDPAYDKHAFHALLLDALALDADTHALAAEAAAAIARAWRDADALVGVREELFARYQDEARRGDVARGTRLAWSLIRVGAAGPEVRVAPGSFVFDDDRAAIALSYKGADVAMTLTRDDYRRRVRAVVDGYAFRTGWTVLFQKPVEWMTAMAGAMREAGVAPGSGEEWEVMEAPEGLIALEVVSGEGEGGVPARVFYRGSLHPVETVAPSADSPAGVRERFRAAAETLALGVMADETIPDQLRRALRPILEGTYKPVDPREYFDSDFCRRLIEADYLETQVAGLSAARRAELAEYRDALAKLERGQDRFAVDLREEGRLIAVTRPEADAPAAGVGDAEDADAGHRDPETGETASRYFWRWERGDSTVFHAPLPSRYLYALSLHERYDGKHAVRPAGTPGVTEVWHATLGRLGSYRAGAGRAEGDADRWQRAVALDARGGRDGTAGPLGWNFPFFVPVRDDQGDPVAIATANGVVASPDFAAVADAGARRAAQDEWLDGAARVLAAPGELALLYRMFFRYCSDSPLPEQPNLIGSHYALSDTHQTVYQTLDRRWVGRLIGDCDDVAEFFQNLCDRQGRLSHVMQLPAHAAAGYLDAAEEGGYEFVVLQTGPVLRFTADSRVEAVEKAYRYFDEAGGSHFTADAVPLLLRFADEDTRTAFVLPARIYWDREYAEKMIAVQGYWHVHAFTAAIRAMEAMLATDRSVGNIKELASLYERVGEYGKSDELRREEYEAAAGDDMAALSILLDLAQLHIRAKDRAAALADLEVMEEKFGDWRESAPDLHARSASFRYSWAALLSRLGEPERAWRLLRHDVGAAEERGEGLSDPLFRALIAMYSRMAIRRDGASGAEIPPASLRARLDLRNVLAKGFGKGYFKADDSNNKAYSRYFWLGRYAVAVAGRRAGLDLLRQDGPYPAGPRDHAARGEDLSEEGWEWFRIMPRLCLACGAEMLDREEYPELYDPEGAQACLERIGRAAREGAGFGSDVMGRDAVIQGELILSFVRGDVEAFRAVMRQVRGRDYASLYDEAATVFGDYCGLAPAAAFREWIEAFHEFFPGRQNYFKAAYRALDKGFYDHAVMLARATAGFFPGDQLLTAEAEGLEAAAERLRRKEREREWEEAPLTA